MTNRVPLLCAWLVAAGLAATGVPAQAAQPAPEQPAAAPSEIPQLAHEKYALPNGLTVILHPDRRVPLVAVDVWYHVGSGNEAPGRSGFAHLFEHMMFQGSQHVGEDRHFDILKQLGSSNVNGTTSTDRTNYYEVLPSHQLEAGLWLESDRMGYLLPLLTQQSLDNQREVVRNERRQSYDNVPYGKERFETSLLLYPEGHPYRYMTIGRHEDLQAASVQDVRAFFQKWYAPANATLIVAGDFEVDKAKALIDKWFGSFPKSVRPERPAPALPEVAGPKRSEVQDPFAKLRRVRYAWNSPGLYAPGDADLDVLSYALGASGTGRLYKLLVHEKQTCQSVSVYQASAGFSSTFNVVCDLRPDADLAEVEKVFDAELDRVAKEPISGRELARAVTSVEASFVWGLEDLLARAEVLQAYDHHLGTPDWMAKDLARYNEATAESVRQWAEKTLTRQHRVEVVTLPVERGAL
jgi:predicted Zn-dependent peptidase